MREILLVALLSLGLRMFNPLSMPIYADEATYLGWALDIWDRKTRAALMIPVIADGKPPLFMWLAGGASSLFPDPLVAGRAVSALAGVLSTVGIYLAGRWLIGRRVGVLAALLYAVVPFNLLYDRLALVEALLNAEGVWVFTLSVFITARARRARSAVLAGVGLGIVLGMALWTKMLALFILPFPFLCVFMLFRRDKFGTALAGFAVAGVIGAIAAVLLLLAPDAGNLWGKTQTFSEQPRTFLTYLPLRLTSNASRYWDWLYSYLPTPLWTLVPVALVWGLIRQTRFAVLLVGSWAVVTMGTMLWSRGEAYSSRYVVEGVFPLLLLLAALLIAAWDALVSREWLRWNLLAARGLLLRLAASSLVLLLLVGSSLQFDERLVNSPESAPLPSQDRALYVTGYLSGYGFTDAMDLLKRRAIELTADGQPVIILSNYYWGDVYGGLKMYLRGIPKVFLYVDSHLTWNPEDFVGAWKPHRVPILLLGNDGLDRLDQFERAVPQAKRLGFFPKPTGQSSFRVYEVDVTDLER